MMKDQICRTTPMELKTKIKGKYSVDVSNYRSWKRKEFTVEEIHGSWEEAYSLLPIYMVQLLKVDGTERTILVRGANKF